MRVTTEGRNLIRKWERLELEAYQCPAGVWTIGYGHTRTAFKGRKIDDVTAESMLTEDMIRVAAGVARLLKVELNDNQFSAVVSLVFNIGLGHFAKSTLLKHLNKQKWANAAMEFPRWNKARVDGKLKVLAGLVARRKEEQILFVTPVV